MGIIDFSLRKCLVPCYDLEVKTYFKSQSRFNCNKLEAIKMNMIELKVSYFVEVKKQV